MSTDVTDPPAQPLDLCDPPEELSASPAPTVSGTIIAELRSLTSFVRRPSLDVGSPRRTVVAWTTLFATSLAITLLIAAPLLYVVGRIYLIPVVTEEAGLASMVFAGAVMAPMLEEPSWRLWLSRNRAVAAIGALLVLPWLLVVGDLNLLTTAVIVSGAISIAAVLSWIAFNRHATSIGGQLTRRGTGIVVYLMAAGFALMHLTNYDGSQFDPRRLDHPAARLSPVHGRRRLQLRAGPARLLGRRAHPRRRDPRAHPAHQHRYLIGFGPSRQPRLLDSSTGRMPTAPPDARFRARLD